MASATDTGNPEPPQGPARPHARVRMPLAGSRLGRLILLLNLLGLLVLVAGALVFNEFRRGLVEARLDSLNTQGQLISYAIVNAATEGDPEPALNPDRARAIITILGVSKGERARLYDRDGRLIADTDLIADRVLERDLPPARAADSPWRIQSRSPAVAVSGGGRAAAGSTGAVPPSPGFWATADPVSSAARTAAITTLP